MATAKSTTTNWFAIWVSAAVVIVLVGLGALVVVMNQQATNPASVGPVVTPESDIIDDETGAITFGSGEDTVDTFVDFMCPICGTFEDTYGESLQKAAADNKITLNLHPISILDRYSQNTEFSTRAASSVYCVASNAPEAALDYFNVLFANQPEENSTGLTDDELVAFAKQVGADAAAQCITDGEYKDFVTQQTTAHDIQGTPTVEVNGQRLDLSAGEISIMENLLK